jgi:transcription-repair coupling factor (superfamily II helicase)
MSTPRKPTGRCAWSSFGDEIESIRKFEPDSQRSSGAIDETWLLPLTETPVSEDLLAAVHQRLSGSRLDAGDDPELLSRALVAGGVSVFPGWEFFCAVAGADRTVFDLFPTAAGPAGRAGHDPQPGGPLVEQGRAAA